MISGNDHLKPTCYCGRIVTQYIDFHPLFEEHDLRSPMLCVEFGECLVNCARAAIKIIVADLWKRPAPAPH